MKIGWRIWLLIIVLLLSVLAIAPSFKEQVSVKSVNRDSSLFTEGLRAGMIVQSVNGVDIKNVEDYTTAIEGKYLTGAEEKFEIVTKNGTYTILTNSSQKISVENTPRTKIKTGLDLRGGARALVSPDVAVTQDQLNDLIQVSRNRFNVYGLSDVQVKGVSDLDGNKFMLIEVAGATPDDLESLIAQQGKFEAKVGNVSVFQGGNNDISSVCRNDATCAGITSCFASQGGGYACSFQFAVYLTESAAKRHAEVTKNLALDSTKQYLNESLYLYVDEQEVDVLRIGASLRGQVATQISIQGSGTGTTRDLAYNDAKESMNKLQTILITGSLPYKLNIVKLDSISPTLGGAFVKAILLAGLVAILLVSLIVFIRYRHIKISLALLLTSFSELVIILGVASFIKWNLDLPSIAGILATIGTGVDQQIVIIDEASKSKTLSIVEKMKKAMFIIASAYFTAFASLLPLYWAGAGLFRGFAFTTLIGITAGVLITRPAFSELIKRIEGD